MSQAVVTGMEQRPLPGSRAGSRVGVEAVRDKGWWRSYRFLVLRRVTQFGVFALFLLGPWVGVWIIKGNLSSSVTLGVIPLTDPFSLAQVLASRHWPQVAAWQGVALVILFYGVVGGRVFCSWVCPVNPVTDGAQWLRRRLGITTGRTPRELRYWLVGAVLVASTISGVTVWEWVNPVSLTHRALIFGGSATFGALLAVFLYDLLVAPRGWCGYLCPVGATYALIGSVGLLRVSAQSSSQCNDCADCFAVCPEPQVIPVALKGKGGASPVIDAAACSNCGRCVDVCGPEVFVFTHRFDHKRV